MLPAMHRLAASPEAMSVSGDAGISGKSSVIIEDDLRV
jgi:hypothetical protein